MQDVEIKKEEKQTGDFRSDSNFLLGYFEEKDGHFCIAMMQSV